MQFYMTVVCKIAKIKMNFMLAVVLLKDLFEKINIFFPEILYVHHHRKAFCKPVEGFLQLNYICNIYKNTAVFGNGKFNFQDHKSLNIQFVAQPQVIAVAKAECVTSGIIFQGNESDFFAAVSATSYAVFCLKKKSVSCAQNAPHAVPYPYTLGFCSDH